MTKILKYRTVSNVLLPFLNTVFKHILHHRILMTNTATGNQKIEMTKFSTSVKVMNSGYRLFLSYKAEGNLAIKVNAFDLPDM